MTITVGIPTAGEPQLEPQGDKTLLRNMLIGRSFHWQRPLPALLPGEVMRGSDPVFGVLNRVSLETYLECVVGSEMNPGAPVEFLKAHAVISRSWAVGKVLGMHPAGCEGKTDSPGLLVDWADTADHRGFDVCSDDHCQRYQGVQPVPAAVLGALRSTAGEVLADSGGALVDARFSKSCGGRTELFSTCWQDTAMPCLESVDDPWCDLSDLSDNERGELLRAIMKDYDVASPWGAWSVLVSRDEVRGRLRSRFGRDVGTVTSLVPLRRGPSGRISLLRIVGSEGTLDLGKELAIRRLLSPTHLYSSAFDITDTDGGFELTGCGWGHGVGLCQVGAARMAAAGRGYREILSHYYPGSSVRHVNGIVDNNDLSDTR